MGKPGTLDHHDARVIADHVEDPTIVKGLYGQDAVMKHLKSDLSIIVDAKEITKQSMGSGGFIDGKATLVSDPKNFNGKIEVPCKVACGHLYKIKPFLKSDSVNILDYLDLLLPKFQNCVGLFTFQNGIQNSPKNFNEMAESILKKLPEKPLCIGFYNGTNGIIYGIANDMERFANEWHLNAFSVIVIRQMLSTLAKVLASFHSNPPPLRTAKNISTFNTKLTSHNFDQLFSINSNVIWTHIAHSEAGLIAHEVLTTDKYSLFNQHYSLSRFLKNHLITLTYGAVAPIPNIVRHPINTYSHDDIATRFYGKPFSKKKNYTITFVDSEVPKKEQCRISGDHAFSKATYQNQLAKNLDSLRKDFGIYDCR